MERNYRIFKHITNCTKCKRNSEKSNIEIFLGNQHKDPGLIPNVRLSDSNT